MAKKDKKAKKDDKGGSGDPVETVRAALERALASAGGAAVARDRTRDLIDDFATFAGRFRESLDDLRVLDEVRSLRAEVERLSNRVSALESGGRTASGRASTARSARSTAASSSRATAAKPARATAAKPARSTTANSSRATAAKPARSTAASSSRATAAKPSRPRAATSSRSGSASSRRPAAAKSSSTLAGKDGASPRGGDGGAS